MWKKWLPIDCREYNIGTETRKNEVSTTMKNNNNKNDIKYIHYIKYAGKLAHPISLKSITK